VAAVVAMVSVAVPAVAPVMLTGVVEPKLRVGGYRAPGGLVVTAAVITTLPVKPPLGVTEIFVPVVAPFATVTDVPPMEKAGVTLEPVTIASKPSV
jgi:hypothetical protein